MDFSKIDSEFSKEIIRGGEAYLDGQLKIATSADQRASSLAGVFIASSTALIAASLALANPQWNVPGRVPLIMGAASAAIMFLIGAINCWLAIMPVSFFVPGCEPMNWETDVLAGRKLHDCLGERAVHIEDQIGANLKVIGSNARKFRIGAIFGILAPFTGVVMWSLASLCHWFA
jgi:hypothetical protein